MPDYTILGKQIRKLRKTLGLSQEDLAAVVNCKGPRISDAERGINLSIYRFKSLRAAFVDLYKKENQPDVVSQIEKNFLYLDDSELRQKKSELTILRPANPRRAFAEASPKIPRSYDPLIEESQTLISKQEDQLHKLTGHWFISSGTISTFEHAIAIVKKVDKILNIYVRIFRKYDNPDVLHSNPMNEEYPRNWTSFATGTSTARNRNGNLSSESRYSEALESAIFTIINLIPYNIFIIQKRIMLNIYDYGPLVMYPSELKDITENTFQKYLNDTQSLLLKFREIKGINHT